MAVVVSFFICWVPFHAQRLLASYLVKDENQNQLLLDIYLKLTYISGVMYYLSSTINPLLYQLMSAKFRLAFKETFNCSLLRCFAWGRPASSPSNSFKEQPALSGSRSAQLRFSNSGHFGSKMCHFAPLEQSVAYAHCSCQLGDEVCALHVSGRADNAANMLARLRGRLNTSLVSLFRLSSNESAAECACLAGCPASKQPGHLYDRLANPASLCASPSRAQTGSTPTPSPTPSSAQTNGATRQWAPCANTPLLLGHSDSAAGERQSLGPSPTLSSRSVLKFLRSPTPNAGQPSLTRLSSRDEDEEQEEEEAAAAAAAADPCAESKLGSLPMGALIKPAPEDETPSLTVTSESGNSSGSSPDQLLKLTSGQLNSRAQTERQVVRPEASSSSSGSQQDETRASGRRLAGPKVAAKRRRSCQQARPFQNVKPPPEGQRRKSSSSSSSAASNKRLACSLSSSERRLDKRLSLSTTTSAIDDCSASFTTTNSQLTSGSNAALANQVRLSQDSSIGAERGTVINI